MSVCSYHVTYAFQSESTLYSCLNVKELLAQNRRNIWNLRKCLSKFHVLWSLQKLYCLIGWLREKRLILIIQFFRGETNQVNDTSFMLCSVDEFGPILPFSSTHFGIFWLISIDICQETELISITLGFSKHFFLILPFLCSKLSSHAEYIKKSTGGLQSAVSPPPPVDLGQSWWGTKR